MALGSTMQLGRVNVNHLRELTDGSVLVPSLSWLATGAAGCRAHGCAVQGEAVLKLLMAVSPVTRGVGARMVLVTAEIPGLGPRPVLKESDVVVHLRNGVAEQPLCERGHG